MAATESEDHPVTASEREFWRSLTVVFEHLHNRALNAEDEVARLRVELETRREQVEYMTGRLADLRNLRGLTGC